MITWLNINSPSSDGPGALAIVDGGSGSAGMLVDLNAVLLKSTVRSPHSAVTDSVDEDETTRWYVLGPAGTFVRTDKPPAEDDVSLLVRRPRGKEPAWRELLRDYFKVPDFATDSAESSGAILFVRTVADGEQRLVAWCFGHGGHWIRRRATSPRFGLLAALNALADSAGPDLSGDIGVIGHR